MMNAAAPSVGGERMAPIPPAENEPTIHTKAATSLDRRQCLFPRCPLAPRNGCRSGWRAGELNPDHLEQRFGVPSSVVLAVWGRETGYGGAKLPHNAIRALAMDAVQQANSGHPGAPGPGAPPAPPPGGGGAG